MIHSLALKNQNYYLVCAKNSREIRYISQRQRAKIAFSRKCKAMLLIKNVFFIVLFFFAAEECVYTFGRGQYGQLGHGTFLFQVDLPKPLEHFWNGSIKHIACGENHTAVITSKQSSLVYILFEPVQSYIKVAFKANLYYYY